MVQEGAGGSFGGGFDGLYPIRIDWVIEVVGRVGVQIE